MGSQTLIESVMGVRIEISVEGWESTTMGRTLEGDYKGQATEGPTKRGTTQHSEKKKGFIHILSMDFLLHKSASPTSH